MFNAKKGRLPCRLCFVTVLCGHHDKWAEIEIHIKIFIMFSGWELRDRKSRSSARKNTSEDCQKMKEEEDEVVRSKQKQM